MSKVTVKDFFMGDSGEKSKTKVEVLTPSGMTVHILFDRILSYRQEITVVELLENAEIGLEGRDRT